MEEEGFGGQLVVEDMVSQFFSFCVISAKTHLQSFSLFSVLIQFIVRTAVEEYEIGWEAHETKIFDLMGTRSNSWPIRRRRILSISAIF